jgi:hypothetical protein
VVQPATKGSIQTRRWPVLFWERVSGERKGYTVVRVLGCVGEHYEILDAQGASRVYRWCPTTVTLQCECEQRPILTLSRTTCCRCGADHMEVIKEVLDSSMVEAEGHSPWRSLRAFFSRPKPI